MRSGRPRGFERQDAIDAALKVFWEHGFENTSMGDLERCVGVGRQSLYNTLGDKRSLFIAALQRYIEQYVQPQIDALLGGPTPEEGLQRWIDGWMLRVSDSTMGCFVVKTTASPLAEDPEIRSILNAQVIRLRDAIIQALQGVRGGSKRRAPLAVKDAAESLLTLHQGRSVLGRVFPIGDEALRRTVNHLIDSIR